MPAAEPVGPSSRSTKQPTIVFRANWSLRQSELVNRTMLGVQGIREPKTSARLVIGMTENFLDLTPAVPSRRGRSNGSWVSDTAVCSRLERSEPWQQPEVVAAAVQSETGCRVPTTFAPTQRSPSDECRNAAVHVDDSFYAVGTGAQACTKFAAILPLERPILRPRLGDLV